MTTNFTININVGAGGVVSDQSVLNSFLANNFSNTYPDFSFSPTQPVLIDNVDLTATHSTFSYQYGYYYYDNDDRSYHRSDPSTGTGSRISDIRIDGDSTTLRALGAGQTADIVVSATYFGQELFDDGPNQSFAYGLRNYVTTSDQITFHFIGVNDAPVLVDKSLSLLSELEDAGAPSGSIGTTVFQLLSGVTDYDNGTTLGFAITGADSTHGTWWYSINNGSTWSPLGTVSESSARLISSASGRLYFQPNANYNGSIDPAITFHAWDTTAGTNGGTFNIQSTGSGGTTAFSTATDTASLTITAVDDPPTITSISALNYTENQTATLLAPSVAIADVDSANFNGGSLKVSFTANGSSADQLSIVTDSHVSVSGTTVSIDSTAIGTIVSSGTNGTALQISLNSAATPSLVATLLQHIAFQNTSDNPSTSARTVKFEVTDDGGATGSTTATINVTAVNDTPVLNGITLALLEGDTTILSAANISIADPDNTSFTYTVSNVTHGAFQTTADGVTWTNATTFTTAAITASHVRFVHDGGEIAPSFSIQANDGAVANNLSSTIAGTVLFTNVNDAPTAPLPTVINFEDIPHPLDGGVTPLASYTASGFTFTSTHAGPDAFESFHTGNVFYPGSAALANSYDGASTLLSRSDGAIFGINGIKLDTLLLGASSQVTFTGTHADGSTVQQTFTVDGQRGFESFAFNSGFHNLVSVAWNQISPYTVVDDISLNASPKLAPITDRDLDNAGQTVGSLLLNVSDPDIGAVAGIAIVTAAGSGGHWEYQTAGTWASFGAVSDSNALLLRASDLVRFVPDGGVATSASFGFHAWDQTGSTAGQQGTYADLTATALGGTTPFSADAETASIQVLGNTPPTGTVTIAGMAIEDQMLTASNTLADADGLGVIGYQWLRNGTEIANATSASYTLGDDDVGVTISVRASYTDGGNVLESVTSSPTGTVANVNDAPTGSVTVGGNAIENATLTASNTLGDADGLGAITYHWQRNGADIANATGSSYTLGNADVGAAMSVRASYTDGHGTAESVTSAATDPVVNVNDAPIGNVTIAGAAVENTILVASNTLTDADGLGPITYHWQHDGVDIANATGSSYSLGNADVGAAMSVRASYTDGHGTEESVTSSATGPVVNVNDTPIGSVTITGAAIENTTLVASNTLTDADGLGPITYHWQHDGADIANATGSSYTLGNADVGAAMSVRASYTDGHGTEESVTSSATGPVVNVNDTPIGSVTITGAAIENTTLVASNTLTDADGLGTITYHWQHDGADIANATGSSYTLGNADVGAAMSVRASYTDGHGTAESVSSAATGPVVNVNDTPIGSVTITGAAIENTTLVASNTLTDADGLGTITYHWQRDGVDIANATGSTYQLDDPDVGTLISVRASYTDGHGTAESVASTPTGIVLNINDAPAFSSAAATLNGITEDDVANAGQTVGSFASAAITDPDAGALKGVAITAHGDGNGHWEYRLFDAGGWTAIGTTSDAAALLLRAADYVRFVPDAKNGTSASLSYHAWDQTDGGQAGTTGDTTHNGGTTAYSSGVATASIAVANVDDIATITTTSISTTESELPAFVSFNVGSRVTIVDVDIDDAAHPVGYVANSGSVIATGPMPPSGTLASLLTLDQATGAVFFDRSAFRWLTGNESVSYAIAFQAQSGDDTPQSQTLTVTIGGLNAAPVLTAPNHQSFAAMTEDDAPSAAHKVSTFRGAISDSDHNSAAGIAITATAGNGDWQYSIDNGQSWHSFSGSNAGALLLRDQDFVRFAPDGKNGGEAGFTYHAWDQTVGSAGGTADATATGGATAFSDASDSVTLAVSSVNDAPVLTPAAPALASVTEDDVGNAGQTVASLLGASVGDVDTGAVQGIALTGTTNGNGHWEYSLNGGTSWAVVGSVAETSALLLTANDEVRFVPDGKNGTSATLTYHAWDQSSGTHGQSVDLTVSGATGGAKAFSVATDSAAISVSDVNDPPAVSGPVTLMPVNEDTPRLITQADLLANATDVDRSDTLSASGLQIASGRGTLADNHDGTWTYTPAQDDDTSVSFSFNVGDGHAPPVSTTAALDILPVDDAPVAQSATASGNEDTQVTGTVSATDVDTPPGSLSYALSGQNGGALHGSATLATNGAYIYTPNQDYFGPDSFGFTASDGQASSAVATIGITVDPVNDPPVITTGTPLSVAENQTFVTTLSATDVDGPNPPSFTITGGADAALFDIVNGDLMFRSARDYETQAHSYQVQITAFDGIDTSAKTLSIDLTDVNDNAPVFTSNSNAPDIVPENTTATVFAAAVTDADSTPAGNSITYSLSGDDAPLFAIDPAGKVHFVTSPDYETPKDLNHDNDYQLTVHANDGVHDVTQDVTVTVTNINEAPVAAHGAASFEQTVAGQVSATDVDSPSLTYSLVSGPAHGALDLHGDGTFSYAAALGYRGADSFSFTANDGALSSNIATYDLAIQQLHLSGTAGDDSFTAAAGNERIDAGTGTDTITFNFKLTDATISFSDNTVTIDAAGSHTVLTGFEIFKFTDGTVNEADGNPLVDDLFYYSQYHDVWAAHADADAHYAEIGWREGRDPNAFFSTNGYLSTYTDVRAAGVNPLQHYDTYGWKEGRDPSPGFDTKGYLATYTDVAAAHVDPLAHFLLFGEQEGRHVTNDGHWG